MQYSILLCISFALSVSGAAISQDINARGLIDFKRVTGVNINIESAKYQGNYTEMEDTANANGANTLEPTTTTLEPTTTTTTLEPTTTREPCPDDKYFDNVKCMAKKEDKEACASKEECVRDMCNSNLCGCPSGEYWSTDANACEVIVEILETVQMQAALKSLIGIDYASLTLCYRAKSDGFNGAAFHTKCNGVANTLTIVQSTKGFVFGGYTSVAWASGNSWKVDDTAYLFSLTNPLNLPRKWYVTPSNQYGVYHNSNFGPGFGGGMDLAIYDSKMINNCYTNPDAYACPDEINAKKNGGTWYHGDTNMRFQPVEVEVFQVV